jgi:hypothetical protein
MTRTAVFALGISLLSANGATLAVQGVTSTQAVAVLSCTQPGQATIVVSESPSLTPLVNAVDATKGGSSGSTIDTGNAHTFVIGSRTSRVGSNGNLFSQALQAATTHYAQGTCPGGDGTSAIQLRIPNRSAGSHWHADCFRQRSSDRYTVRSCDQGWPVFR